MQTMTQTQMVVISCTGWFVALLALVYGWVVSAVNGQTQDTIEHLNSKQPPDVTALQTQLRQVQSELTDTQLELASTMELKAASEAENTLLRRDLWVERKKTREALRALAPQHGTEPAGVIDMAG